MTTGNDWAQIHAERERLLDVLERLTEDQWSSPSLCTDWTVRDVVAHLTAAAHTGRAAWISSMVRARFDASKHNNRLLAEHLGDNPGDTLARFRASVPLTIAPTKDYPAWLGEVIVHGQDIARPLGIDLTPDPAAVNKTAHFYASKDFAVNSRSAVKGLRVDADNSEFSHGSGPVIRGNVLDLVMAMAGRQSALDHLSGEGVSILRSRIQ